MSEPVLHDLRALGKILRCVLSVISSQCRAVRTGAMGRVLSSLVVVRTKKPLVMRAAVSLAPLQLCLFSVSFQCLFTFRCVLLTLSATSNPITPTLLYNSLHISKHSLALFILFYVLYIHVALLEEPVTSVFHCNIDTVAAVHMMIKP